MAIIDSSSSTYMAVVLEYVTVMNDYYIEGPLLRDVLNMSYTQSLSIHIT